MVAYIIQSHTRVPGHWWLLGVIYQDVEDEDYEDDSDDSDDSEDDMHLVNDNTSYGVNPSTQDFKRKTFTVH